jgi:hypothetical protein
MDGEEGVTGKGLISRRSRDSSWSGETDNRTGVGPTSVVGKGVHCLACQGIYI